MKWSAQRIKDGHIDEWVPCSCVSYAKTQGVDIPRGYNAQDFKPNSTPIKGGLVLLKYQTLSHVAVIVDFTKEGMLVKEANYKPCTVGTREIKFNDKRIVGFWKS